MKLSARKKIAIMMLASILLGAAAWRISAATVPPYRISGSIPGTALSYERLFVTDDGGVTVAVVNTEKKGVRFRATFSFYSAKNELLTGFILEGVARASSSTGFSLKLPNHKRMKNASYMRVLGRAGRVGGDDWE